MARPSKPANVLKAEGKAHRTKAELQQRAKAEDSLLSKTKLSERQAVRRNPHAHAEFLRVQKLMRTIEKDDGLYTAVINRYCEIYAEVVELQADKAKYKQLVDDLQAAYEATEPKDTKAIQTFVKDIGKVLRQIANYDIDIMLRRKMLTELERENVMTVAAALRTVPKEVEKPKTNAIVAALQEED